MPLTQSHASCVSHVRVKVLISCARFCALCSGWNRFVELTFLIFRNVLPLFFFSGGKRVVEVVRKTWGAQCLLSFDRVLLTSKVVEEILIPFTALSHSLQKKKERMNE